MENAASIQAKLRLTLASDNASQQRFEVPRTERVRKGKRWINIERTDYAWARWGRTHLNCPVEAKWNNRELGFWLSLEILLNPMPTEHLGYEALRTLVEAYAQDIASALTREVRWDMTSPITISLSAKPTASASSNQFDIVLSETATKNLDAWAARLAKGEAEFDRSKRILQENISEYSSYYDDTASTLRVAARFIDSVERSDATPNQWVRDYFPSRIEYHLNDLLARKMPSSHGFKVAYQHVTSGVYNAWFPLHWAGSPPF